MVPVTIPFLGAGPAQGKGVLAAGSLSFSIESVRLGDEVLATDPVTGLTTLRTVTRTFTTHGDKDFTRLTTPAGTASALVHNNDCEWQAGDDVRGPAAGKILKRPNARHTVSGAKSGEIKEKNNVIHHGQEKTVASNIKAIDSRAARSSREGQEDPGRNVHGVIADLLISRRLDPAVLSAAFADAVEVPGGRVDVCHEGGDQDARDWKADVLCTYHYLRGDVAMSLDVYVRDEEGANCSSGEPRLAAALAERTGAGVLYPDDRVDPSTYWLAEPGVAAVRIRLIASEDDPPVYTADAVEAPSLAFPYADVTPLAEVLREASIPTPLAATLDIDGRAVVSLTIWEQLVRRMASGWPPAGRYLPELYAEDMRARDKLEHELAVSPEAERVVLAAATAEIDALFRELTEEDPAVPADARWWRTRRPRHEWAD